MFLISNHGRFLIIIVVIINIYITSVEGRKCVCTSKDCKEAGENTCETKYFCYTELIPISDRKIGENTTTRGCTQSPTPLLCETKSWITRSKLSPSLSSLSSSSFDNKEENKENDTIENNRLSSTIPWIRVSWPRLNCCDSQDYCNADYLGDVSKYLHVIEKDQKLNKLDKKEEEEEEEEVDEKEGDFFMKKMNGQNNITYQNIDRNVPANSSPQLSDRIEFYNPIHLQSIESDERSTNNSSSRERIIPMNSDSLSIMVNENSNIDEDIFLHQIRPLHIAAVVLAISALLSVFAACYVITRLLKSNAYIIGDTE
ncbi:PREDICTED: uncharacterized protein LOC106788663 [Polistes canadensis]|uniref:uncharacterized protein LOC106788663 n=1 Tax=Polistes canadensis TaxID=91411 RepID=UPI000718F980|nr:PREDICTED: uncharacterized protein LOC106788663 [Polistes canadensis]